MSSRLGWAAPDSARCSPSRQATPVPVESTSSPVGGELVVVLEPQRRQFLLGVIQLAAKLGAGLEGAAALGVGVVALPFRRLRRGDRCLELVAQLLYVALQLVDPGARSPLLLPSPWRGFLEVGDLVPGEVQLLGRSETPASAVTGPAEQPTSRASVSAAMTREPMRPYRRAGRRTSPSGSDHCDHGSMKMHSPGHSSADSMVMSSWPPGTRAIPSEPWELPLASA